MRLGVHFPHYDLGPGTGAIRAFAEAAEDADLDYLTIGEHVLGADPERHERPRHHSRAGPYTHDSAMYRELFVLLGYLAAITERITLVSSVLVLPQRQTALVAKQAAEVDLLSRGRLVLGVGVGWNRAEFEALGQEFGTRGRRCEEQITFLRELWGRPLVRFEGAFDRLHDAGIHPRPERSIPIWIGGMGGAVLDRIGALADGWLARRSHYAPMDRTRRDEDFRYRLGRIRSAAEAAGRDPASIAVVAPLEAADDASTLAGEARRWEELGATHVTLNTREVGFTSLAEHLPAIRVFGDTLGGGGGLATG